MRLTQTQKQIIEKESQYELEGKFYEHLRPINWKVASPVTPEYNYLPDSLPFKIWSGFLKTLVFIFCPLIDWVACGTVVRGKSNLRGVKKCVCTCNHVHELDNMMVRQAVRGINRRLYIAVAEFNNRNDIIGSIMRAGGTMPFSQSVGAMRNMNAAMEQIFKKNSYLLCFPEGTLWWRYEKVRPYLDGAFHYAAQNNVPVVPMFITFKKAGPVRHLFTKKKVAVLNILKPVYPKQEFSKKQNIQFLKESAYSEVKALYEEFYKKPLQYDGEPVVVEA